MDKLFIIIFAISIAACKNQPSKTSTVAEEKYKKIGEVIRYDAALDSIVSINAKAEIIAEGFKWSEGSIWVEKQNMLLFSDVPSNTVYKWTEEHGAQTYLVPSGYTDTIKRGGEMGSNGLTLDNNGNLVLCQHGDRDVARMDAPLDKPVAKFVTLANKYKGKRFSSPNDVVFNREGEAFFTDPPYGLESKSDTDSKKEIKFNGVYKVKKDGKVILLTDSISRPNGIAFFPDQKKLLVASSDPQKPNWYVWDVKGDALTHGKIFYSASAYDPKWRGLPDGLRISKNGTVFATGPGGVYIFDSTGKKLGLLKLDEPTSNCALSPDEKTLYVTNNMLVLRVKLRN